MRIHLGECLLVTLKQTDCIQTKKPVRSDSCMNQKQKCWKVSGVIVKTVYIGWLVICAKLRVSVYPKDGDFLVRHQSV